MSTPPDQLDIPDVVPDDSGPNLVDTNRFDIPEVDTSIDRTSFDENPATRAEVETLDPPQDISAATIGEYTPYTEVTGEVGPEMTVEGRLGGLLSQNNAYIQRARTEGEQFANRRGLLNSSMAAGAAEGAAIDRALPIAQQDASAFLKQHFLNLGYSNEAAKHLADSSITRENLAAGFEQDTNVFNATQQFEADKLNQAAENQANTALAAETNKNNFAALDADLKGQLAGIDNELAKSLETLTREYSILENLDSVQGSIYQQLVNEMGTILATEKDPAVAQAKINTLLVAANAELEFSGGLTGPGSAGITWGAGGNAAPGGGTGGTGTGGGTGGGEGGGEGEGSTNDGGFFGGSPSATLSDATDATAISQSMTNALATLGMATPLGVLSPALAEAVQAFSEDQAQAAAALGEAVEGFSAATGINVGAMTNADVAAMLGDEAVADVGALTAALADEGVQAQAQADSIAGVSGHGFGGFGAGSGDSPGAIGGHDTSDNDAFSGFGGFSDATSEADNPGSTGGGSSSGPAGPGPGQGHGSGGHHGGIGGGDNDGGGGGGGGASGDGPGSKILCTTLNDMYGFGSFRNQVWMKYAAEHPDRYLTFGYHKVFFPLARRMRTSRALEKVLTRIVRVRTNRLRREMHGKPISVEQGVYKYGIESALIVVGWLVSKGVISKV